MRTFNFLLVINLFLLIRPILGHLDYTLAVFYYPWYSGLKNIHWNEGFLREKITPAQFPQLGYYDSFSNSVIDEHISWSEKYGINTWIVSWWGQQSNEDNWLNNYIKERLEGTTLKFCVLYDSGILSDWNWDNSATRSKFKNDMLYIANKYFNHPNYFRIDNKPVIYVYVTRGFYGNHSLGIKESRQLLKDKGYEVYFIADGIDRENSLTDYDALSLYLGLEVGDCMSRDGSYPYQNNCFQQIEGNWTYLKSEAKKAGIKFIPNISPGFNKDGWGTNPNQFWSCPPRIHPDSSHVSVLSKMCDIAKTFVDSSFRYVTVTSFNEWHEDTQIEPTNISEATNTDINGGIYTNGYYYKGYGTDRLEIIAKKFNKTITSLERNHQAGPVYYSLEQNYPNPFNPTTNIEYFLEQGSEVEIKIFDILGNHIFTLVNEFRNSGKHKEIFNANYLSSGVYFYAINVNGIQKTKSMILLK